VITDVDGVLVGHWTDAAAETGCTVVLLPEGAVASGEVRGGAPATREFDLLAPNRLVSRIDAVVMSGGSAFGLATADGVMRWCAEQGRGFVTAAGPVPIVVAMCLFDLREGEPAPPDAAAGYAAAEAARPGAMAMGLVGAGTGATYDKWRGRERRRPGGLVGNTKRAGPLVVSALVAVNAWGGVRPVGDTSVDESWPPPADPFTNTTLAVVVTNAQLDKMGCFHVAQGGSDGVASATAPAHASADGDAVVAVATGAVEAPVDQVRFLAHRAVEMAIRGLAGTGEAEDASSARP